MSDSDGWSSCCVDRSVLALVCVPSACCTCSTLVLGFLVLRGVSGGFWGGVADTRPDVGVADTRPDVPVAIFHLSYSTTTNSPQFLLVFYPRSRISLYIRVLYNGEAAQPPHKAILLKV